MATKQMASFRLSEEDRQNLQEILKTLENRPDKIGTVNKTVALSWALQIALKEAQNVA